MLSVQVEQFTRGSVYPSLHLPFCDHIATTAMTGSRVGAGLRVIGHLVQIQC